MIKILTDKQKQLVTDNEKLIYYGIHKFGYGNVERFYGAASVGLCRAAETFNPDKKCTFSTYALRCICNAIHMDYRSIEKQKGFNCLSLEQNYEYNKAGDSEGSKLQIEPCADDLIEPLEDSIAAHDALNKAKLTEKEKKAFYLWLNGNKQKEIGKKMGFSRSYITRLIGKARTKIRKTAKEESCTAC